MSQSYILRVYQPGFWAAYWITMRPYLLFVSGAAGLVGLSFTTNVPELELLAVLLPLFLSYGFGQALTDCFQTDTDSISSPYRPLVKGIVTKTQVAAVSLVGLVLSAAVLVKINPQMLIPGVLAIFGLATYSYLKRTWWGGPPWNSWIVMLLPVIGRLTDLNWTPGTLFDGHEPSNVIFLLALSTVFFGYANFVVMGYFKDISADRATGYRTFPVVFGWMRTAIYSDITALAAAFSTGMLLVIGQSITLYTVILFAAALFINTRAQIRIHMIRSEEESHGPIANVVRAFVLYCLSTVAAFKPEWFIFLVLYYALFEWTLWKRPERSQV